MSLPSWLTQVLANLFLFILIGGMAASVDTGILRDRFKKFCGIGIGLGCQYVILPLVGYASAAIFDLPPVFGISLIAVTSSPGGAYSNWWCSLFNADLALSVTMTTCSTLMSVALTPLNLFVYTTARYGKVPSLNWAMLLLSIGVAISAILSGVLLSYTFPRLRRNFNIIGNIGGVLLISFGALVSLSESSSSSGSDSGGSFWNSGDLPFYFAVSVPCIVALVLSFCVGMLSPCLKNPEVVAITVETSYQNTGLGLTIALATFDEDDRIKAAGVPLFYGAVQIIILPLFLLFAWKTGLCYAPRNMSFCEMIKGDHQPKDPMLEAPDPESFADTSNQVYVPEEARCHVEEYSRDDILPGLYRAMKELKFFSGPQPGAQELEGSIKPGEVFQATKIELSHSPDHKYFLQVSDRGWVMETSQGEALVERLRLNDEPTSPAPTQIPPTPATGGKSVSTIVSI